MSIPPPIDLFRAFQKSTISFWQQKNAGPFVTHAFYQLVKELDGHSATRQEYPGHSGKTVLTDFLKFNLIAQFGQILVLNKTSDTFLRATHQILLKFKLLKETDYPEEG